MRYAGTSTSLKFRSPASCFATSRYSRMASRMFARASSSVAPCDQHPGSPGQETLYPSSVGINATGYFMSPTVAEQLQNRLAADERNEHVERTECLIRVHRRSSAAQHGSRPLPRRLLNTLGPAHLLHLRAEFLIGTHLRGDVQQHREIARHLQPEAYLRVSRFAAEDLFQGLRSIGGGLAIAAQPYARRWSRVRFRSCSNAIQKCTPRCW